MSEEVPQWDHSTPLYKIVHQQDEYPPFPHKLNPRGRPYFRQELPLFMEVENDECINYDEAKTLYDEYAVEQEDSFFAAWSALMSHLPLTIIDDSDSNEARHARQANRDRLKYLLCVIPACLEAEPWEQVVIPPSELFDDLFAPYPPGFETDLDRSSAREFCPPTPDSGLRRIYAPDFSYRGYPSPQHTSSNSTVLSPTNQGLYPCRTPSRTPCQKPSHTPSRAPSHCTRSHTSALRPSHALSHTSSRAPSVPSCAPSVSSRALSHVSSCAPAPAPSCAAFHAPTPTHSRAPPPVPSHAPSHAVTPEPPRAPTPTPAPSNSHAPSCASSPKQSDYDNTQHIQEICDELYEWRLQKATPIGVESIIDVLYATPMDRQSSRKTAEMNSLKRILSGYERVSTRQWVSIALCAVFLFCMLLNLPFYRT